MLVNSSTEVNVRYLLVKLAFANVQVAVSGYGSAVPAPFAAADRIVASPLKRTEPAQRDDHRPPLGRAVGAVLRADVEHLRLAAAGQRGAGDRGRVRRRLPAAHLVERRGGHRGDLADDRGEGGAGRGRRPCCPPWAQPPLPPLSTRPSTTATTTTIAPPASSSRFAPLRLLLRGPLRRKPCPPVPAPPRHAAAAAPE